VTGFLLDGKTEDVKLKIDEFPVLGTITLLDHAGTPL
jgi:hypothetical protein